MNKRVLVTGGAGFVGSHLIDALLGRGHSVTVYDNMTPQVHSGGMPEYLSRDVRLIRGDMRDLAQLCHAVRGADVIFHLAAAVGVGQSMYEIANYMGANTQGTANLLQAILDNKCKIDKLVLASSMSIYGEGRYRCENCGDLAPPPRDLEQLRRKLWEAYCPECANVLAPLPTDESKPLRCTSFYALSKKDQEEMCLLFGRTYGVPVIALRYFNIYGTRQALSNPYTGVAAIFASRLMNGNPPLVFEDGEQKRDFVNVQDVVQANLLAMERPEGDGMALNIGSGRPVSISEMASVLAAALGVELQAKITGKCRAGDIRHCFADVSRAAAVLGYAPKVEFQDGIVELVGWLRSQTACDRAAQAVEELNVFGLTA